MSPSHDAPCTTTAAGPQHAPHASAVVALCVEGTLVCGAPCTARLSKRKKHTPADAVSAGVCSQSLLRKQQVGHTGNAMLQADPMQHVALRECCVCGGGVLGRGRERSVRTKGNMQACTRTNLRNKGLISADRRTSLLSCLQYPVPYLSRLQRIYLSQCFTCDDV
jgi:hypothetical protein